MHFYSWSVVILLKINKIVFFFKQIRFLFVENITDELKRFSRFAFTLFVVFFFFENVVAERMVLFIVELLMVCSGFLFGVSSIRFSVGKSIVNVST